MTELDAAARQILEKVRMFLADETRFGVLSSGERIAVAVVLDRYDLIQRAWGTIAWPLHGPQRHCACNATAGRRTAPTNHLPRPAHGRVGRFPGESHPAPSHLRVAPRPVANRMSRRLLLSTATQLGIIVGPRHRLSP